MAKSANISANASVHQPIRESWHIQFEKAE
ncbi:hypothetical protein ABH916_000308 [Peribacillus frigoritolerans]